VPKLLGVTPGVNVIVRVEVVELFALITDVNVSHTVVLYVVVARAATVVVTRRVEVDLIVVVPIVEVLVEV